ncbi:MAG: hypothetical protein Q4C91_09665 [Eubacteriales bacterium]|nr:hypothetical protein [Eubacteriales bacterium]
MARKKIVFVIVEGPSDDEALGVILNRLYDRNAVHVEITHGDITSDLSVTQGNIAAKIGNILRGYAKSNHYKSADFQQVIHLIDMDGAYIPEVAVVEDKEAEKPFYTTTEIRTAKPDQIILRNKRKSENINRICSINKVWGTVPYNAYYMSSNLDHVLYNKLNSTDDDKENDAYAFAKKYKDHLDDFLTFISDSDFSVYDDFRESWEYIKTEKHSLERHTNLGICFKEIRQKRKECSW